MATFVANYLDAYHITLTASDNTVSAFKDSEEVSSWAASALELMRTTGIIKGDDAGNFRPKDTATRAEAATIFYRLIQSTETYPGYDYTIYLVGASEIYSGYTYCFFIETENPDAESFGITIDSGSYVSSTGYWDDIESTETDSNLNQVDGGYILTLNSSSKKYDQTEGWISSNLSEIDIYEIGSCNSEKQVKSVTVDTIDYTEAQTAWINSLIEDYTSNDMTPFEKMDAICSYLKSSESGFTYLPNDGTYLLTLTSNSGPYFVRKTWNSYTSPAVLCLIAEAIGEFDYIHNCYYDYSSGTDEWKSTHYYCKVGIGDDIRSYQMCPLTGTGYVDTITYVDFTATESMTLLG